MTQANVMSGPLDTHWTGRIAIPLRITGDRVIGGSMDAKITPEAVHLWFAERSVADMDRATLREWLHNADCASLTVDDLTWSHHAHVVWVTISENGTATAVYNMSCETHQVLMDVI